LRTAVGRASLRVAAVGHIEEVLMVQHIGRFVWYELLTSDPHAAVSFYTDVIGWKAQAWENEYTMWVGGQGPLGGTMTLPAEAKKMGAPPHWTSYVQVADVDASAAEARKLGGQLFVEPTDLPKLGRFAVIGDPQGATICMYKPLESMGLHDSTKPGEFTWSELATTDHAAAFDFYGKLFGWHRLQEHDMGPMGTYLLYGVDGQRLGGMFNKPKEMPAAVWLYYIEVEGLDARVEKAKAKGAKLLNGPMDVPGGARIAQLMDPQGAAFAMHETAKGEAH
jgi:predicted enzyme related to lactoylglutathione lyase